MTKVKINLVGYVNVFLLYVPSTKEMHFISKFDIWQSNI